MKEEVKDEPGPPGEEDAAAPAAADSASESAANAEVSQIIP